MAVAPTRYFANFRDVLAGRTHVYYGWRILAVGTIALAFGGGLSVSSLGLYVESLEDEFGWSRAEVSLAFSASVLASGVAAPLIGSWVDRRGARSIIIIGGVLTGLSFMLLAATEELWQFYLLYGVHAVFRQMMFFLPFQSLVSRWFDRKRGTALSILGCGFSLGAFLILPIVALSIAGLGWRGAYILSGAAYLLLFVPACVLVLRNRPSDVGEEIDGGAAPEFAKGASPRRDPNEGLTLAEAARTPLFWLCAFGFMLLFFGMMGWLLHQVPFYESAGMSRATATGIVSLIAVLGMAARLIVGMVADRFDRFEGIVVVLLGLQACAMATLLASTSIPAIAVFIVCWVIGSSMGPMVESLVLIRAFGLKHFGSLLGAMLVVETSGQIVSPAMAGYIYDSTGSYDGALIMFMAAFLTGALLFAIAMRMKVPLDEHRAAAAVR